MRLLDLHQCDLVTGILKLFDTEGKTAPSFAILSHRWQTGEVLFADLEHPKSKQGYAKIANVIQLAQQHGHEYPCIDFCCIDKSSSAELSEAINSMWTWYSNATVCYVYLCDVSFALNNVSGPSALGETECDIQFLASVWFTGDWTLQELLAPESLQFYSSEWVFLGDDCSLRDLVSKASGISTAILGREQTIAQTSIARRMSWASRRTTTRIEDIAYCLLGIFSVNMPLLYGEGHSAFIRLQESILRSSDDYSIFTWMSDVEIGKIQLHGILAGSPAVFKYSGSIMPYQMDSAPCTMTNKGLSIALELVRGVDEDIALLPCLPAGGRSGFVGIHIREIAGGYNQYARTKTTNMAVCSTKLSVKSLFFPQDVWHFGSRPVVNHNVALRLDSPEGEDSPYKPIDSLVYFHAPLKRYSWKSNAPYESP